MERLNRIIYRAGLVIRRAVWRMGSKKNFSARALFIFGVQRSGTTMLKDCFDRSPDLEVFGEASPAMKDWRIRDESTIREIVGSSPRKIVVFKPLTDSHRVDEILNIVPSAKAIWMYRRFEDRANSAVARFGPHNQEYLTAFSKGERLDSWQAMGLTSDNLALIRTFDYQSMTPQSASAVFWYVRNALYFQQGLDKRGDVLLLAYEDLVMHPRKVMPGVCRFMDCHYDESLVSSIHSKSVGRAESDIDDRVRLLCEPMYEKLRIAQDKCWRSLGLIDVADEASQQ